MHALACIARPIFRARHSPPFILPTPCRIPLYRASRTRLRICVYASEGLLCVIHPLHFVPFSSTGVAPERNAVLVPNPRPLTPGSSLSCLRPPSQFPRPPALCRRGAHWPATRKRRPLCTPHRIPHFEFPKSIPALQTHSGYFRPPPPLTSRLLAPTSSRPSTSIPHPPPNFFPAPYAKSTRLVHSDTWNLEQI